MCENLGGPMVAPWVQDVGICDSIEKVEKKRL